MRQPHARITHLFFFVVVPLMHIFCINDQGILSPDDDRNQIPLAQFRGSAIMDTAWGPEFINKLNTLKNPRVELSWQYFGYTRYTTSHDIGNIPAQWPYLFSGTLLQPLPREVYEYDEPAIGTFWLYGAICLIGFVVLYLQVPETKGRTLEQIERQFAEARARRHIAGIG